MNKQYYTYNDLHDAATDIVLQMYNDAWRPDYIVGLNRGGLPLALRISHLIDINMYTLDVRLRDGSGNGPESNCWMAEDAFGYVSVTDRDDVWSKATSDPAKKKNILIVDDINDTGATFNWIKDDWQKNCLLAHPNWDTVWGQNVRFATMCEKTHTDFDGVNYNWKTVDTSEGDPWIVFPWEYDK
jgi:hypoxanthine phosphoribosyltransferase